MKKVFQFFFFLLVFWVYLKYFSKSGAWELQLQLGNFNLGTSTWELQLQLGNFNFNLGTSTSTWELQLGVASLKKRPKGSLISFYLSLN
jgi:hypothetical protein